MNHCPCGGTYLRHGKTSYKGSTIVGVRYICRECRQSHTERFEADSVEGREFIPNGRPIMKDWRFANEL